MYTVVYWNERDAQWKGVGAGTFASLEDARKEQYELIRKCDGCVRFKVTQTIAS